MEYTPGSEWKRETYAQHEPPEEHHETHKPSIQ
jgi:hypothetical protein